MGFQLSRTRQAVAKLLEQTRAGDEFSLITFSDQPKRRSTGPTMPPIDVTDPADLGMRPCEQTGAGRLLGRLCVTMPGGRCFQMGSFKEIDSAVDEVSKEMRSQYVLGYAPEGGA